MKTRWIPVLIAVLVILVGGSSGIAQQRGTWLYRTTSDHPDTITFGLSEVVADNRYCPAGDDTKDVVWQWGANASPDGQHVLDSRFAAFTLNWEPYWCHTDGNPMSEFQIRYITPGNDWGRLLHAVVVHDSGLSRMQIGADQLWLGEVGQYPPTVWFERGGVAFFGAPVVERPPLLDMNSPTLAQDVAEVLALYGLVELHE